MPTRRGRVSLAAGAALLLLARGVAINELYALGLAALVFPIAAVVFVRLGRHRLAFSRAVSPQRLFAGGKLRSTIGVRNLGRGTSPPLVLDEPGPAALGGPERFAVPPLRREGRDALGVDRPLAARGRYTLGPVRARLIDPFGLAETTAEVTGSTGVVVYPRVESLVERSPREARGGNGQSALHRLASQGDEFYAVRDWQDGDDLRKIHWRSSARRDELMIRQDEVRPFPRATVLVDTRAEVHAHDGSSLEYALSAAASIVWELARQGFALRVATADAGPGGARWGRDAIDPLLTTLALAGRARVGSLHPAVRKVGAHPGGALFAILPPPPFELAMALSRARRGYPWCGAILLDNASFGGASGRARALYDQRLADSERTLARGGWRVTIAGASDPLRSIWPRLLDSREFRRSSPSARS